MARKSVSAINLNITIVHKRRRKRGRRTKIVKGTGRRGFSDTSVPSEPPTALRSNNENLSTLMTDRVQLTPIQRVLLMAHDKSFQRVTIPMDADVVGKEMRVYVEREDLLSIVVRREELTNVVVQVFLM